MDSCVKFPRPRSLEAPKFDGMTFLCTCVDRFSFKVQNGPDGLSHRSASIFLSRERDVSFGGGDSCLSDS